ncbi:MAG: hypothetical protein ACRDZN_09490 [Acidimicrobiales bacterium]
MNLVWAVPVVAAAVATALVALKARAVEDAAIELRRELRKLSQLRPRLADVRRAVDDTELLVDEFRARHPVAPVSDNH